MRKAHPILSCTLALLALFFAVPGRAEAPVLPRRARGVNAEIEQLRRELSELRAAMALLQSKLDLELRDGPAGMLPSMGVCADPCAEDADGDGIGDCEDLCPCDASNTDTDLDGALDCYDPCPDDATDDCINPCRLDSDGDGTGDCDDACPYDPAVAVDVDGDGVADCSDPCPEDATNTCGGMCGLDQDGDGLEDCSDPCPFGPQDGQACLDPTTGGGGMGMP